MLVAAKAGIHEVIGNVDMKILVDQLWKHCRKQFVPPADVTLDTGGGSFDVSLMAGGGWALPMLKGLVGPDESTSLSSTKFLFKWAKKE